LKPDFENDEPIQIDLLPLGPLTRVLQNNKMTLQTVTLIDPNRQVQFTCLSHLIEMPSLKNLAWLDACLEDADVGAILYLLLGCHNLQTLTLKRFNPVSANQFSGFVEWRSTYFTNHNNNNNNKSHNGIDGVHGDGAASRLEYSRLTNIQTLILDGSEVVPDALLALCGVMPNLRVLSMKSTNGLNRNLSELGGRGR
jgi:hypothetical protein